MVFVVTTSNVANFPRLNLHSKLYQTFKMCLINGIYQLYTFSFHQLWLLSLHVLLIILSIRKQGYFVVSTQKINKTIFRKWMEREEKRKRWERTKETERRKGTSKETERYFYTQQNVSKGPNKILMQEIPDQTGWLKYLCQYSTLYLSVLDILWGLKQSTTTSEFPLTLIIINTILDNLDKHVGYLQEEMKY